MNLWLWAFVFWRPCFIISEHGWFRSSQLPSGKFFQKKVNTQVCPLNSTYQQRKARLSGGVPELQSIEYQVLGGGGVNSWFLENLGFLLKIHGISTSAIWISMKTASRIHFSYSRSSKTSKMVSCWCFYLLFYIFFSKSHQIKFW